LARFLYRLGMFTARRKWFVLGAWVVLVGGMVLLIHTFGSNTSNNLDLPGTNSQAASNLLTARFPPQQNGSNPIVFYAKTGKVTDAKNKQAIQKAYAAVKKQPHVYSATSPFSQQGQAQISKDKHTAFISVLMDVGSNGLTQDIAQDVFDTAAPGKKAGMEVAVGGSIGSELSEPATESSEVIGLAAAMIILAFTFGTFVAMGLPIVSAVFGLLVGLSLIGLLGHAVNIPTVAPTLATMIGLGVGIDYALFLVSRYRALTKEGLEGHEAVAKAVATAGSAIVFAGTTVVIALITLLIAGIPLVTSLGYASAFAVVTAVLAAITLLPAILSLLGKHVESLRVPAFLRTKPKPPERGFWGAWARTVTGHPWLAIGLVLAVLVPLIIPFLSLNLGQEDIGATPKSTTERQAYDLMAAGFGVGYNGPLVVAVSLGTPAKASSEFISQKQQAQSLQKQLEQEQKQGKSQQQELTAQSNSLKKQQQQLEQQQQGLDQQASALKAQQAALEADAKQLTAEQRDLQAQADRLKEQQVALSDQLRAIGSESKQLVREGAGLAKKAGTVVRRLSRNRVQQRKIEAKLNRNPPPPERARLEAQLRKLQRQEQRLEQALDSVLKQERALLKQQQALVKSAQTLRGEEIATANHAIVLASDATSLAKEAAADLKQKETLQQQAADLQVQAADLQVQAAKLQTQAANLNTQKVELQGQQQTAKTQQQQAEQLQSELTAELTKAGGDERGTDPRLVTLQDALGSTEGVKVVSPPDVNGKGDATTFGVVATTAPAATQTADLVKTLRTYTIPQATQGTDLHAYVGGQTASYVDLASGISSKLFLVIAAVIALGFLVLMTAFRSVLVPTQAAIANVLSVMAAFGIVTACFQWGWGISLVGLDTASGTDPIASYVPLIMFAVLFGLSMDYQVFLMSQIEHHRAQGEGDHEAVAGGLASGARVIVAAALIMMSVFASFILNGDPTVKQFGVGLSVGVGLAALTVLLFAPAFLVLAGRGSWWLPQWAERFLPNLDIEGARLAQPPAAPGLPAEAPPVRAGS
jgi:uncharacterized membrane protein YdfJ with MMPL/SSD domain